MRTRRGAVLTALAVTGATLLSLLALPASNAAPTSSAPALYWVTSTPPASRPAGVYRDPVTVTARDGDWVVANYRDVYLDEGEQTWRLVTNESSDGGANWRTSAQVRDPLTQSCSRIRQLVLVNDIAYAIGSDPGPLATVSLCSRSKGAGIWNVLNTGLPSNLKLLRTGYALYAISADTQAHLYQVDKVTGELTDVADYPTGVGTSEPPTVDGCVIDGLAMLSIEGTGSGGTSVEFAVVDLGAPQTAQFDNRDPQGEEMNSPVVSCSPDGLVSGWASVDESNRWVYRRAVYRNYAWGPVTQVLAGPASNADTSTWSSTSAVDTSGQDWFTAPWSTDAVHKLWPTGGRQTSWNLLPAVPSDIPDKVRLSGQNGVVVARGTGVVSVAADVTTPPVTLPIYTPVISAPPTVTYAPGATAGLTVTVTGLRARTTAVALTAAFTPTSGPGSQSRTVTIPLTSATRASGTLRLPAPAPGRWVLRYAATEELWPEGAAPVGGERGATVNVNIRRAPPARTTILGWTTAAASAKVGTVLRSSLRVTPVSGRTVVLQVRTCAPTSSACGWKVATRATATATTPVQIRVVRGKRWFRVTVPATTTALAATTGVRVVTGR